MFLQQEEALESVTDENAQLTSVNSDLQQQLVQLSKVSGCHLVAGRVTKLVYVSIAPFPLSSATEQLFYTIQYKITLSTRGLLPEQR